MDTDERFMREALKQIEGTHDFSALKQAKKAAKIGDTPIGCVIVYDGAIIARGYNRRNKDKNTLAHAEITAIRRATKVIGDWRLEGCTIYVTLEPCPMCAGAIVQARIPECVIGILKEFFRELRKKQKDRKLREEAESSGI